MTILFYLFHFINQIPIAIFNQNNQMFFFSPLISLTLMFDEGDNIKITDETKKNQISIQKFIMSPESSTFSSPGKYLGMIVYYIDGKLDNKNKLPTKKTEATVVIKNVTQLTHIKSEEGGTHGKLCKWYFGLEPSEVFAKLKAVVTGFEILRDEKIMEVRDCCQLFNSNSSKFHSSSKNMQDLEKRVIQSYLFLYGITKQRQMTSKVIHAHINGQLF